MRFFRKYQKGLFALVAIVTIGSFSFFGALSQAPLSKQEDLEMLGSVPLLNGSEISEREVRILEKLLVAEENVFALEFIETGIGTLLAERYYEEIEKDLKQSIDKAKGFNFYAHPIAPWVSLEEVWRKFYPDSLKKIQQLKIANPSCETFHLLETLFLDQRRFSEQGIGQMFLYQMEQMSNLPHDPNLSPEKLHLFGNRTIRDWFGPQFIRLAALFIKNSAHIAEDLGFKVSLSEAKADLLQSLSLREIPSFSKKRAAEVCDRFLERAGVDKKEAVVAWRDVLLFQKLFLERSLDVSVDPLLYETIGKESLQSAIIEKYALKIEPSAKFRAYVDLLFPKAEVLTVGMLSSIPSVEDLEARCPDLLQKRVEVEISKVSLKEVMEQISLKETFLWEVSAEGWDFLQREFSEVRSFGDLELCKRGEALDKLSSEKRKKIDSFARKKMVLTSEMRWKESLEKAISDHKTISMGRERVIGLSTEISDELGIANRIATAPIGEPLFFAAADNTLFYKVAVLSKAENPEIALFEEVKDLPFLQEKSSQFSKEASVFFFSKFLEKMRDENLNEQIENRIAQQFVFTKEEQTLFPEDESFCGKQVWSEPIGFVSQILEEGQVPFFFKIKNRVEALASMHEQIKEGNYLLGADAKRRLAWEILGKSAQTR